MSALNLADVDATKPLTPQGGLAESCESKKGQSLAQ